MKIKKAEIPRAKISGIWEILSSPANFQGDSLRKRYEVPARPATKKKSAKEAVNTERVERTPQEIAEAKKAGFIKGIYERFGVDQASAESSAKLEEFVSQYKELEELGKVLFGNTFVPKEVLRDDIALRTQFQSLNSNYGYFEEDDFESFIQIYETCLYVANYIENNNNGNEVVDRAYKAMVLFGKEPKKAISELESFIKNHGSQFPNPIHDIFYHDIPKNGTYDLESWQALMQKSGMQVIENLPNADKIDKLLGHAPKDIDEMNAASAKLRYKRASENERLAELFHYYKVSEKRFNRCLDLIADGTIKAKLSDSIPSVILDLHYFDASITNQYLVKLPPNDPRGMILGDITKCCQSVGGNSEKCVIDGMNRENQGFYVLIKTKKPIKDPTDINWDGFEKAGNEILGQGYIWRSKKSNLVFDSWENKGEENDWKLVKNLPELSKKMKELDNAISRVTIGVGGKTPKAFKDKGVTPMADVMIEGFQYGDSNEQIEIFISEELARVREEFSRSMYLSSEQIANVISVGQAEDLKSLSTPVLQEAFKNGFILPILSAKEIAQLVEFKLSNANERLYNLNAIFIYKLGYVVPSDLIGLTDEKLKALTCGEAIETYKTGYVTFDDLKDLDADKITTLTSYQTRSAYESRKVTVADLKDLEIDKIIVLTSPEVKEAYRIINVTLAELRDLDVNKIKALTYPIARETYKTGYVSFAELRDLDVDKINVLVSEQARNAYKSGHIKLADLRDLNAATIESLISNSALEVYKTGGVTVLDLRDLDVAKIKVLLSDYAFAAYGTGKVTVSDLIDDTVRKINIKVLKAISMHVCNDLGELEVGEGISDVEVKELLSWFAIAAYKTGKVTVMDLKGLNVAKIKALTSRNAVDAYKTGGVTVADLKNLDAAKIAALTSYGAIAAYKTGKITFADLTDDTVRKINIKALKAISMHVCNDFGELGGFEDIPNYNIEQLLSLYAIHAYKTGTMTVMDLKGKYKKIEIFTHQNNRKAYEGGYVTFADLKDFDNDKIDALTDSFAIEAYKNGYVTFADLKDLDAAKISALTYYDASDAYKSGKVTVADLKDLDLKEISIMISKDAIAAYKSGKVTFADLKGLNKYTIEDLTSKDAIETYQTGAVTAADLKGLGGGKIQALTSKVARETYQSGKVTFVDLKDLDLVKLHSITSSIWKMQTFIAEKEKSLGVAGKQAHGQEGKERDKPQKVPKKTGEVVPRGESSAKEKANQEKLAREKANQEWQRTLLITASSAFMGLVLGLGALYALRTSTAYPKDITYTAAVLAPTTLLGAAVGYFSSSSKDGQDKGSVIT